MSGERPGYRDAMQRLRGRMVRSGMTPREADKRARETAIKRDQRERDKR